MSEEPQKYDVFQAIADPTRRKLLELLAEGQLSIASLSSHFTMSRTAVTKHLGILESAGLVSSQKAGREKLYRLEAKPLQTLKQWLEFYEQYWDDKLEKLKMIVEEDK
ncbi:winged helix-turn-helix transcriptional regulator [Sporosarcina sp. Marseille-Q4063]|uniref:ArsR/SmtB family transcription factor n=1 Tax=Sporosarcina sp. Marseille-Q4063 TaxID=2810514 RepID=UPI001BAFB255|nr:metalloregulator ArsR/SmtB family transcription factor [Sporosarcina sp. Marseille-Q4063]QUW23148.1 winged helix-turn-helix transcriptional regulator [Sporosarcina sp. Marseille-Q4063]